MATIIVDARTAGATLWRENEHKKGALLGLKVDNNHVADETIQIRDSFTTDDGYTSGGSAYTGALVSGLNKLQLTVPAGDSISLGKEDCEGIEYLGTAIAVASVTTSNCIITAQYELN